MLTAHDLYLGYLWTRGDLNKRPLDAQLDLLERLNIDVVTTLFSKRNQNLIDHWVDDIHQYRHAPLPDGKNVPYQQANAIADRIVESVLSGKRNLIHCQGGKNRAGLVGALCLMRLEKLTGAEALAKIRSVRPNSVANPAFSAYLESLPRYIND